MSNFSGQGGTSNTESPKEDDVSNADTETKDSQKLPFCEIQWQKVTEFVKTRKIKTPEEKPYKEKVRWSYSPDEGPKCTTETFSTKKKDKKTAHSPVQVWNKQKSYGEILIWIMWWKCFLWIFTFGRFLKNFLLKLNK